MNFIVKTSPNRNKFIVTLSLSVLVVLLLVYLNRMTQCDSNEFRKIYSSKMYNNTIDNAEVEKTLFCLIKTTPGALKNNKTLTVYKVWASRCSNHRFITIIPTELKHLAQNYGKHREIQMPFYLLHPDGLQVSSM